MSDLYRDHLIEILNKKYTLPFEGIEDLNTWNQLIGDSAHFLTGFVLRDVHIGSRGYPIITSEVLDHLVEGLKGQRVADVGCGTGYLSYHLLSKGINVTPIDNRSSHYSDIDSPINDKIMKCHYNEIDVSDYDTFIISWPNYLGDDIEVFIERLPKGAKVIYQGEWQGCTGTEDFHFILDDHFTKDEEASRTLNSKHITFSGIHDKWFVYVKD